MRGLLMVVVMATVAATGACATAGGAAGEGQPAPQTRRTSGVLEAPEIEAIRAGGASDALTLIERARPQWLRARQHTRTGAAMQAFVFYNGQRMELPILLRNVAAEKIIRVRFVGPVEARGRWGRDGEYGVILVEGH